MKSITEIDPNFKLPESIPDDIRFLDAREEPFSIWGLVPNEQGIYSRLPLEFLPECSAGVQALASHLAGACVRFSTDADQLAVLWTLTDPTNMPHFTASGQSGLQ